MGTHYIKRHGTSLTRKQYDILSTLRDAHQKEQGLVPLPIKTKHDGNTLRFLQERDWIIESTKVFQGERRFAITSRGLKLMKLMDAPSGAPAPATDLCFQCGEKPRYFTSGGYRSAYCHEHHNANKRAHYAKKRSNGYKAELPCSRCKRAPRAVAPSGRVYAYCTACRRAQNIERRMARAQQAQQSAAEGHLPLCAKCHEAPVHLTAKHSYAVCKACLATRARIQRRRLKQRKQQDKLKAFFKRG